MKPAVKVWRSRFAAGWMLSAVCAFSLNAAEPLMVNGVVVEASAATAAAARDMAIVDGQRRAFRELIEHLAPGPEATALAKLSDAEIAPLIAGFEVADRITIEIAPNARAERVLARFGDEIANETLCTALTSASVVDGAAFEADGCAVVVRVALAS